MVGHGASAGPPSTLYWNFIDAHESEMRGNMRTALMVNNLDRLPELERQAIRRHAAALLENPEAQADYRCAEIDGLHSR